MTMSNDRYADVEEVFAHVMQICQDMRCQALEPMYEGFVRECARFPRRAAQLLMALAALVDYEAPLEILLARVDALVALRERESEPAMGVPWLEA